MGETGMVSDIKAVLTHCSFVNVLLAMMTILYPSATHLLFKEWFYKAPVNYSMILALITLWSKLFHVFGFGLVSGYIYRHFNCEKGRYTDFASFFKNRFMRIVVLCLLVLIIWAAPWHMHYFDCDYKKLIFSFVFGINTSQPWFLLILLNVFVLAYLENSFTIYLFNQQIIYTVIAAFDGQVSLHTWTIINFAVAICVYSCIAIFVNQWRITRILTGQRKLRKSLS